MSIKLNKLHQLVEKVKAGMSVALGSREAQSGYGRNCNFTRIGG